MCLDYVFTSFTLEFIRFQNSEMFYSFAPSLFCLRVPLLIIFDTSAELKKTFKRLCQDKTFPLIFDTCASLADERENVLFTKWKKRAGWMSASHDLRRSYLHI